MKWLLIVITLYSGACLASTPNSQDNEDWNGWPTVGTSSLSWLFFELFDSELKTPTGVYEESSDVTPHALALLISYLRDVPKDELLKATTKQWTKLGYADELTSGWLVKLDRIYQDINEGDRLVYITDGSSGEFIMYDRQNNATSLGVIKDEQLNDAFLSIWLSPNTQYLKHRNQLLGKKR